MKKINILSIGWWYTHQRKGKIILLIGSLILALFTFLWINDKEDIVLKYNMKNILFKDTQYTITLENYKDFIGLSLQNDIFTFYKYNTSGITSSYFVEDYPNYKLLKLNSKNDISSKWKKTPIIDDYNKFPFDIAYYSNFHNYSCTEKFLKKNYLLSSNNYYTYFINDDLGVILIIYIPEEKNIYIIQKKQ